MSTLEQRIRAYERAVEYANEYVADLQERCPNITADALEQEHENYVRNMMQKFNSIMEGASNATV